MLFNSVEFLLFLPIVFLLYWFVFKPRKWQNLLIIVASYVFYGWWDWRFLFLIVLTSFSAFASGILIERSEGNRKRQKIISAFNIVINISILCLFKYYGFFVVNLSNLLGLVGIHLDWITINVVLPVGISFYTFQALSYSIDVYQHKIKATYDLIDFFAYISFFPQLVAGPIERATNLLPQFQKKRQFEYGKAIDGCRQMLWGFFKKMVIADNCANVVEKIWEGQYVEPGYVLWIGALFFTIQIFCDFSGYSDIAIGCAKLFGFNLIRNFNNPYFSRSVPEFWRRWHISLTKWFTDYIYIPLGGSRCSKKKTIFNVFIVWGISGLWHGANWTFVCWGLYHAVLLSVYILMNIDTKQKKHVAYGKMIPSFKEISQMSLTFVMVLLGWVIFRSKNMVEAIFYLTRMFSFNDFLGTSECLNSISLPVILFVVFALLIGWVQRERQHAMQIVGAKGIMRYPVVRLCVYYFVIMIIFCYAGSQSEFIYFQF